MGFIPRDSLPASWILKINRNHFMGFHHLREKSGFETGQQHKPCSPPPTTQKILGFFYFIFCCFKFLRAPTILEDSQKQASQTNCKARCRRDFVEQLELLILWEQLELEGQGRSLCSRGKGAGTRLGEHGEGTACPATSHKPRAPCPAAPKPGILGRKTGNGFHLKMG